MADARIRVEVTFDGGHGFAALVSSESLEEVERALADGGEGAARLEVEDGSYVFSLRRVVYIRRFARESRVGFARE